MILTADSSGGGSVGRPTGWLADSGWPVQELKAKDRQLAAKAFARRLFVSGEMLRNIGVIQSESEGIQQAAREPRRTADSAGAGILVRGSGTPKSGNPSLVQVKRLACTSRSSQSRVSRDLE